jgi:hypothetical protein
MEYVRRIHKRRIKYLDVFLFASVQRPRNFILTKTGAFHRNFNSIWDKQNTVGLIKF